MEQTIYFFTSRSPIGRLTFDIVSELNEEHRWFLYTIESKAESASFESGAHSPDLIVSFLNPYIIPKSLLDQVRGRAFNVHPATPDYPGRDPQHFAFYEGASVVGATLHRMDESVDSGEILDVLERSVDRSRGIMNYIEFSERLSTAILVKNLPAMLEGSLRPLVHESWHSHARHTRKDFLGMCRIDPGMDREEVKRRIEAFFNPAYRSVYVEVQGYRFVYDPSEQHQE